MKICLKCREDKPLEAFSKNPKYKDGLNRWCRVCHAAYRKEHHQKNKERAVARIIERRKELRKLLWEYKAQHSCADCGESNPIVLQFDHLRDKIKDVTKMVSLGWSWKNILAEIEKCEIVCANCHIIRTFHRGGFYAGGDLEVALTTE